MKKSQIAFAAGVTSLFFATTAEAACKKHYYTGTDRDPIWWQGRDFARSNWSDKVKGVLGGKWSRWSKASNKSDTCDWLPTKGVNYCVARAKPCK